MRREIADEVDREVLYSLEIHISERGALVATFKGTAGPNGVFTGTLLRNVTVADNAAGPRQIGGGIVAASDITLRNVTVSGNSATAGDALATASTVDIANTIIDGGCYLSLAVTSRGGNVESGTSCGLAGPHDQRGEGPSQAQSLQSA